jgi:hypothetical protein
MRRETNDPPSALIPATFLQIGKSSKFTLKYGDAFINPLPQDSTSIIDNPIFKHLIGPYPPSSTDLAHTSYRSSIHDLRLASDGSYYRENGGAGHSWLFATRSGRIISSGPGAPFGNEMSLTRSKLLGILSTLYILYNAETNYPIQQGTAIFLSYELTPATAVLSSRRPPIFSATQDNHDIIMEIYHIKKHLKTKISIEQIQRNKKNQVETPEIASCEEASHIAQKFGSESPLKIIPRPPNSFLPLNIISVQNDTGVLTVKGSTEITESIHKPALLNKVKKDTKWSPSISTQWTG